MVSTRRTRCHRTCDPKLPRKRIYGNFVLKMRFFRKFGAYHDDMLPKINDGSYSLPGSQSTIVLLIINFRWVWMSIPSWTRSSRSRTCSRNSTLPKSFRVKLKASKVKLKTSNVFQDIWYCNFEKWFMSQVMKCMFIIIVKEIFMYV